jgi:hypothetical protein
VSLAGGGAAAVGLVAVLIAASRASPRAVPQLDGA